MHALAAEEIAPKYLCQLSRMPGSIVCGQGMTIVNGNFYYGFSNGNSETGTIWQFDTGGQKINGHENNRAVTTGHLSSLDYYNGNFYTGYDGMVRKIKYNGNDPVTVMGEYDFTQYGRWSSMAAVNATTGRIIVTGRIESYKADMSIIECSINGTEYGRYTLPFEGGEEIAGVAQQVDAQVVQGMCVYGGRIYILADQLRENDRLSDTHIYVLSAKDGTVLRDYCIPLSSYRYEAEGIATDGKTMYIGMADTMGAKQYIYSIPLNEVSPELHPGWRQDDKGVWYKYVDGSYPKSEWQYVDTAWYYFDENGYRLSGVKVIIDGTSHTFNQEGKCINPW